MVNGKPGILVFDSLVLEDTVAENGRIVKARVSNILLKVLEASDSLVTVQMQKGAQPVLNHWKLIRYAHSDSLTIQNYMEFDFKWYPWERFSGLLLDRSYGPQMEAGLRNLKALSR